MSALEYAHSDAFAKSRAEFGSFEIEPKELEFFDVIGSGSFGDVYRGKVRGKECAIKKLKGQTLSAEALAEMRKEVKIMSDLYHPNIVLFMGACFRKGAMAMVTELLPEGSVSDLLRKPGVTLTLLQRLAIARDAALGMNWLHTRNPIILHRDLKPANLLIDEHWNVKVCDFGLSTAVERGHMWEDEDDIPGTPLWMAPEVMLGKQIDGKSDVYSFGLCVWELFSGEEPFSQFTNFADFRRAVCAGRHRPKHVPLCPLRVQRLIELCWDEDPDERPSFAQLVKEFPKLMLKCVVNDSEGRLFWQTSFHRDGLFPLEVKWEEFGTAFAHFLKLSQAAPESDPAFLCLKTLITEKSRKPGGSAHVVTLERFGDFVHQFGPLEPGSASCLELLEELATEQPKKKHAAHVFHGNIDSREAEKRLAGQKEGTWLVRVSNKDATQPFVISKVSRKGAINHQRIKRVDNKFSLEVLRKDGSKLVESDDAHLVAFLKKVKDDLYLRNAAPGSDFAAIFSAAPLDGYLG